MDRKSRKSNELNGIHATADITLWDRAIELHEAVRKRDPGLADFEHFYNWYLVYGFLIKTPQSLLLAHHDDDTWYIYLAITNGSLLDLLEYMPYQLKYMQWGYGLKGNSTKFVKIKTDRFFKMLGAK